MAILEIPGLIALVSHSSGGAILSTASGGYAANTLIPASIVAGAPAVAVGAIAVTAALAAGYLYLHGVPPGIAEVLFSKGVAASTSVAGSGAQAATAASTVTQATSAATAAAAAPGIAVPVAAAVTVLVALAAVGYVAYTQSEDVKNWVDKEYDKFRKAMGKKSTKPNSLAITLKNATQNEVMVPKRKGRSLLGHIWNILRNLVRFVFRF